MRRPTLLPVLALGAVTLVGAPAHAGGVPVLVVPGRPDVPVMINGVDASWCVVDGDWGLERPSIGRFVTCRAPIPPPPAEPPPFFPMTGEQPRVGRLEVRPAHHRPRPAESFYRVWTTPPDTTPATVYAPFATPSVEVSTQPQASAPAQNPTVPVHGHR